MKKLTKKNKRNIIIGIILLAIIGVILSQNGLFPQSIVSISTIPFEEGGKVYWLISSVGDSIDEGFSFKYRVGDTIKDYEKNDGSIVKPQKSMDLYFTKEDSKCEYVFSTQTRKVLFGLWKIDYFILNNPSRVADIEVRDSNGQFVILNGARNGDVKTIYDKDGKGSVTIKALGLIGAPQDCPNYENVALINDGNDNLRIVYKSDYENKLNAFSGVFGSLFGVLKYLSSEVRDNSQFTSSFDSYPQIDTRNSRLVGDIEIGSGFFTVTADQDYFDSVTYIPPKQAKPKIKDIFVNDIKTKTTSSVRVDIINDISTKGVVTLKANAENSGIIPSSTQFTLISSATKYFTLTAGDFIGDGKVCFEVCSTGQFDSPDCDSDCENFKIIKEDVPTECGDGICQSNENNATCPEDCRVGGNQTDYDCKSCFNWFTSKFKTEGEQCQSEVYYEKKWHNPMTWILPEGGITQDSVCPIFIMVMAVVGALAILIFTLTIKITTSKK